MTADADRRRRRTIPEYLGATFDRDPELNDEVGVRIGTGTSPDVLELPHRSSPMDFSLDSEDEEPDMCAEEFAMHIIEVE